MWRNLGKYIAWPKAIFMKLLRNTVSAGRVMLQLSIAIWSSHFYGEFIRRVTKNCIYPKNNENLLRKVPRAYIIRYRFGGNQKNHCVYTVKGRWQGERRWITWEDIVKISMRSVVSFNRWQRGRKVDWILEMLRKKKYAGLSDKLLWVRELDIWFIDSSMTYKKKSELNLATYWNKLNRECTS